MAGSYGSRSKASGGGLVGDDNLYHAVCTLVVEARARCRRVVFPKAPCTPTTTPFHLPTKNKAQKSGKPEKNEPCRNIYPALRRP